MKTRETDRAAVAHHARPARWADPSAWTTWDTGIVLGTLVGSTATAGLDPGLGALRPVLVVAGMACLLGVSTVIGRLARRGRE